MSDKHIDIEKKFLLFLLLSLLVHGAVYTLFRLLPEKKQSARQDPYFIDLAAIPNPAGSPAGNMRVPQPPRNRQHPRDRDARAEAERSPEKPASASRQFPAEPGPASPQQPPEPRPVAPSNDAKREPRVGDGLTKPRKNLPELAKLLPSSNQMKGLEDRYRKELGVSLEGGFSRSLDSEDMMLTSFLSRFVRAVNDNLPYYSNEQARKLLVETKGLVSWKVTVVFNRGGRVEDIRFKSTGSSELDESLLRAIHAVGPLGALPKSYDKDLLRVPFIYSISGKRMSG